MLIVKNRVQMKRVVVEDLNVLYPRLIELKTFFKKNEDLFE